VLGAIISGIYGMNRLWVRITKGMQLEVGLNALGRVMGNVVLVLLAFEFLNRFMMIYAKLRSTNNTKAIFEWDYIIRMTYLRLFLLIVGIGGLYIYNYYFGHMYWVPNLVLLIMCTLLLNYSKRVDTRLDFANTDIIKAGVVAVSYLAIKGIAQLLW